MPSLKMTRRITFSSGHRYWNESLSAEANRDRFGKWASPYNHGHNYVLDVTVAGPVEAATGMVVNIKRVDDVLKERVKSVYDQRSINDEVETMRGISPSLEMVLEDLWRRLDQGNGLLVVPRDLRGETMTEIRLVHLRLEEMPTLFAEKEAMSQEITVTRVYEFAAAHRLHATGLSDETNVSLYGKCNHVHGHGHNYVLEVSVAGVPDAETGFLCDLGALDLVVEREVLDRYDHRNLDIDVPELQGQITTSENVAIAIFERLKAKTPAPLARVKLWETARNAFEVSA